MKAALAFTGTNHSCGGHTGLMLIEMSMQHFSNLSSEGDWKCIHCRIKENLSTWWVQVFCAHILHRKRTALCIEPLLIHLWPTDQKYSWKWQLQLALTVYSLLMQQPSMMAADRDEKHDFKAEYTFINKWSGCNTELQASSIKALTRTRKEKSSQSLRHAFDTHCCWTLTPEL